MKFRKLLTLSLLCFMFFFTAQAVSAHILQTDHTIGAVMHIDPEDDPILNEPATFYFDFKDTAGKFTPAHCLCQLDIIQDGQSIQQLSLLTSAGSTSSMSGSYIFSQPAVYTIRIKGESENNDFSPFTLDYEIRVSRTAEHVATHTEIPWRTIVIVATALLFIILVLTDRFYDPKKKIKLYTFLIIYASILTLTALNVTCAYSHELMQDHHHGSPNTNHFDHPCCLPQVSDLTLRLEINPGFAKIHWIIPMPASPSILADFRVVSIRSPPASV